MFGSLLRFVRVVFSIALVAALLYTVFVLLRAAVSIFAVLDKTIAATLITAATTVVVAVITIVLGKLYEQRQQVQKENRDKRIPVYEDLLKFMFRFFDAAAVEKPVVQEEMNVFMSDFNQRFIVWGSDAVIAAWVRWRKYATMAATAPATAPVALFVYEDLIYAIRRDLGHRNSNLGRGDILAIFINDVDQILAQEAPK